MGCWPRAWFQEYEDDEADDAASWSARGAGLCEKPELSLDSVAAAEEEEDEDDDGEAVAREADAAEAKKSGGVAGWGGDGELSEVGDEARETPALAAFAVAEWAGRATLGLALEPGCRALSGLWNHLRALCIVPRYSAATGDAAVGNVLRTADSAGLGNNKDNGIHQTAARHEAQRRDSLREKKKTKGPK